MNKLFEEFVHYIRQMCKQLNEYRINIVKLVPNNKELMSDAVIREIIYSTLWKNLKEFRNLDGPGMDMVCYVLRAISRDGENLLSKMEEEYHRWMNLQKNNPI